MRYRKHMGMSCTICDADRVVQDHCLMKHFFFLFLDFRFANTVKNQTRILLSADDAERSVTEAVWLCKKKGEFVAETEIEQEIGIIEAQTVKETIRHHRKYRIILKCMKKKKKKKRERRKRRKEKKRKNNSIQWCPPPACEQINQGQAASL